eukprot:6248055-Amphidinium_carterae.1
MLVSSPSAFVITALLTAASNWLRAPVTSCAVEPCLCQCTCEWSSSKVQLICIVSFSIGVNILVLVGLCFGRAHNAPEHPPKPKEPLKNRLCVASV